MRALPKGLSIQQQDSKIQHSDFQKSDGWDYSSGRISIRTAELISDHLGWEIVIFTASARDKVIYWDTRFSKSANRLPWGPKVIDFGSSDNQIMLRQGDCNVFNPAMCRHCYENKSPVYGQSWKCHSERDPWLNKCALRLPLGPRVHAQFFSSWWMRKGRSAHLALHGDKHT